MHELSIATAVLDNIVNVSKENKVKKINLIVGTSSAIIDEALLSAFDALKLLDDYSTCSEAVINIKVEKSTSICEDCGVEFSHGVGAAQCPQCNSYKTQIIRGRDIYIDNIEVES